MTDQTATFEAAVPLSTPCASCRHTFSWHTPGKRCQVRAGENRCGCLAFVTPAAARQAAGQTPTTERTLTPLEHDRAWHAIEHAAGQDDADPGTVLNAVLRALRINAPTAEDEQAAGPSCSFPPCNVEADVFCERHQRKQAHSEGEHAFCGSECAVEQPAEAQPACAKPSGCDRVVPCTSPCGTDLLAEVAKQATERKARDRAAILREAADAVDRETAALRADGVLEPGKFRPCRDASAQLRRMAVEETR